MADTPLLLNFPAALPPSMDFAALLAEAMGYAQDASGDYWTDYNEHDPGLTILEQLCYALTDLGLRGQYEMTELLADERGVIARDTLFTGDQILTCAPLTANDYRKLVYDSVHGLKNFWIEPVEGMPGLYCGWIEQFRWGDKDKLVAQVTAILRANRTLCEDIVSVEVLKQQSLKLAGVLELSPGSDPDEVMGTLLFYLDWKLLPAPMPSAIEAQIDAGQAREQIYEGPRLAYGTIDDAGLVERPATVNLAQIARVVQAVPGVRLLSGLHFVSREDVDGDVLTLKDHTVPFIDIPPQGGPWPFELRDSSGASVLPNAERVTRVFNQCYVDGRARESAVKRSTDSLSYRRLPSGRYLDVQRYHSIQHQFPVTYGLSRYGIPDDFQWQAADAEAAFSQPGSGPAAVKRAAQVKQLRAYLMLFEQVLANAFAQLANARWLFSLRPPEAHSYFAQSLVDNPQADFPDPDAVGELLRDLRAEDRERHGHRAVSLRISHPHRPALRAIWPGTLAERQSRLDEVLSYGSRARHYRHRQAPDGKWIFVLVNVHGMEIAEGELRADSQEEIEREVLEVVYLLERIRREPAAHARHVRLEPHGRDETREPTVAQSYLAKLERLMAQFDPYPQRHNAFLDHLLARFNERFEDDLLQRFDPRPAADDRFLTELASWKSSFLMAYPRASSRRASGFDYSFKIAKAMPFGSGLEHRLYSLLGIGGPQRFARYPQSRARLTARHPGYHYHREGHAAEGMGPAEEERALVFEASHPGLFAHLLRYGTDLARYRIRPERGGWSWELSFLSPGGTWHRLHHSDDAERLKALRNRLVAWLQPDGAAWQHLFDGEGLYVLEHILLRPLAQPLAKDDGFYACRISVLLPDWPVRFQNDEFKRFAERLVRENCPAHVQADCYWLSFAQMERFEHRYEAWASAKYKSVHDAHQEYQALDERSGSLREFLQHLAQQSESS
ncbi:hypothetical protein FAZ69_13280 [Trinickia terrae]|uniref:Uncharacterized protein n=1 Tax=Trinickia terrae TaxID=2571161 RepID=A0A4U1I5T5_9BURK|nr:hypothetical protein [Trinickia terrae]TKC88719.1 hypothetical protein FAZ69_13280 [Trinickia terrae]